MNRSLLEILACPKCKGTLTVGSEDETIDEGTLNCGACSVDYPITNGIPRFVPVDNYASSFGYQWNQFRKEQLDSFNGTTLSADRLWSETAWSPDELSGKWVLDAGCGAGRFLDVASRTEGQIVGIDISSAVDASKLSLGDRNNVHLVQASIYDLPFREGTFDFVYSIGVIQHTPDPAASLQAVGGKLKPGGKLAVTIYPRKPWTKLFSKYWIRPFTRRMEKERLLKLIEKLMPVAFPITDVLFRIPVLGRFFSFAIPVANYVGEKQLSREQRYAWAVLDTFDMLSPYYDQPMTEQEARDALRDSHLDLERTPHNGLNLVGVKG
jgi:SAM-dependent methyltransferase